jgi:hypothetical protein
VAKQQSGVERAVVQVARDRRGEARHHNRQRVGRHGRAVAARAGRRRRGGIVDGIVTVGAVDGIVTVGAVAAIIVIVVVVIVVVVANIVIAAAVVHSQSAIGSQRAAIALKQLADAQQDLAFSNKMAAVQIGREKLVRVCAKLRPNLPPNFKQDGVEDEGEEQGARAGRPAEARTS